MNEYSPAKTEKYPRYSLFSCDDHFPNLQISNPAEVLVSSDIRPSKNLTFYNVEARQGSSFRYGGHLNFQVYGLRDIKMAAREGSRVGQITVISQVFAN